MKQHKLEYTSKLQQSRITKFSSRVWTSLEAGGSPALENYLPVIQNYLFLPYLIEIPWKQ